MNALKENNEKNKDEKEKRTGIVTKESIGAVGVLFSALAFLILVTRGLIFGDIGEAIASFLLGVFGDCAYPLLLVAFYISLTSFIGKRFIRSRKAVALLSASAVCLLLILHVALTYKWALSGYISACFSAGKDGYFSSAVTGWIGGLIIYPVVKLTTRVGALIIFSALFLLCVYLSACVLTGGKFRLKFNAEKKKGQDAGNRQSGAQTSQIPVQRETVYPSAPRQEAFPSEPSRFPSYAGQAPTESYSGPVPEVRQRPGVNLPSGEYRANGDYNSGAYQNGSGYRAGENYPTNGAYRQNSFRPEQTSSTGTNGTGNAFSPFGIFNNGNSSVREERKDGYREYQQSKEYLFGGTPAEIYRKNLIFDSNANVNKRPPADPNQPTVYDSAFADSYSAAYADAVNGGEEPARPAKILTDNTRGQDLYTPRTLRDSDGETGFGNVSSSPSSVSSVEPIQPAEPFRTEQAPVYRPESIQPMQTPNVHISDPRSETSENSEPRFDTASGGVSREERGAEAEIVPPEEPKSETSGTRPGFFDIFSPSNPNIYGRRDEEETPPADEPKPTNGRDGFGRDFSDRNSSRGLLDSEEPDVRGGERSVFESGREEDELLATDRKDIFDEEEEEDPYTLRSDFSDSRRGNISEEPSDRLSSRDRSDPFVSDRREQTFEEPPRPVPPPVPKPRVHKPYQPAPLDYFDCRDVEPDSNAEEVENNKMTILETLDAFKVTDATIASVTYGPTVTRYNVVIPRNISAKKVVALDQEIAMSLYASKGVNIYPNFEDGAVSIEVPNKNRQYVQLGCMLTGEGFVKSKPTSLVFAMGKDVGNRKIYGDICKMTHLLVAGASGSGKSVFLRSLIISLIYKYSPDDLRLILIDPKKTEFVIYDHLPHLMINEIITDINKVIQSLNWAIGEMNRRYGLFEQKSRSGTYVVNIDEYNANLQQGEEKLAKIVIIVDELADLMLAAKKEVEDRIQNLTQKSRAAGIHLILATQRPSADVITGVIKGNLPTRIAFSVAAEVDSRVILDASGAQKLLGNGDLLYIMAGMNAPTRVQGASISSEDAQKVINYIKANNEAEYDETVSAFINNMKSQSDDGDGGGDDEGIEEVYIEALRFIIQSGSASISMIQRKCSVGYNKAGKIIEWMEDMGYISAFDGAKARKVLITKEEFESKYGPL